MPKGFFVTGTDTGVGKTVITAALIRAAAIIGLRACGMKPIETGCKKAEDGSGTLIPADGLFLKETADMKESIDLVTPVRFENPLAPFPASEMEGKQADMEKIKSAFTSLSKNYDAVIVEGIGGLLVPINKGYYILDLAKDLGLPVVVAARPGLGTISHTLLTVTHALREGITVAGIIINYSNPPEGSLAERTNPEVIKETSPVPLTGILPYLRDFKSETIEEAVVKNFDLEIIKKYL